ncbi:MAG: hypothetical protein R3335_11685 [Anaerolineales bacterium]|nr:hypothetical protein [Anaerolineales bacterium]
MNRLLDFFSDYFAHRKGLLPLLGILLVAANFIVRLLAPASWLAETDLLLHLGLIISILGILLAWAL